MSMAASQQEQAADPFRRPPSGAFAPQPAASSSHCGEGQEQAVLHAQLGRGGEGESGGGSFAGFSPPSSRPMSGAFDEFSTLPSASTSVDFGDDTASAADAFNSLPSAPPTPHSSAKIAESPLPVARPVVATPVRAPSVNAVRAIEVWEHDSDAVHTITASATSDSTPGAGFGVDELHNLTVGGASPAARPRRGSSANVPSGPPPELGPCI